MYTWSHDHLTIKQQTTINIGETSFSDFFTQWSRTTLEISTKWKMNILCKLFQNGEGQTWHFLQTSSANALSEVGDPLHAIIHIHPCLFDAVTIDSHEFLVLRVMLTPWLRLHERGWVQSLEVIFIHKWWWRTGILIRWVSHNEGRTGRGCLGTPGVRGLPMVWGTFWGLVVEPWANDVGRGRGWCIVVSNKGILSNLVSMLGCW